MGVNALAIKPFCSGGMNDARLLTALQPALLRLDQISPYRYRLPLAPAVAARREGHQVPLRSAIQYIRQMRRRCACLLVEGCGGLLTPLGEAFTLLELIRRIDGHTIVVAPNRLGAINQVLLTVRALEAERIRSIAVALTNAERGHSIAARTNAIALSHRLRYAVLTLRHLGDNASETGRIGAPSKNLQKILAGLLPFDTVCALLEAAVVGAGERRKKRVP
jgi:dethiobiotin synthetase